MSWISAIKQHALASGGKYSIPKKDTAEYAAVKAIQATLALEKDIPAVAVKVKKPRTPRVANVFVEAPEVVHSTSAVATAKPKIDKVPNAVPDIAAPEATTSAVRVRKIKTVKAANENPIVRRKKIVKAAEGVKLEPVATTVSFA